MTGVQTCAEILDLQSGSSNFPEYGEVAMMFFTSPAVIRASWPGYIQIMQFEQDIMEYTQDVVVNLSNTGAKAELRRQYGLKEFEINSLLLATREYIKNELDQESDDMQRASLYRKYERIGQDARGISPEKEAAAMKALSDLKGLNKSGEGRGGVELNKLFKDADTMIEEGEIDYEEDYLSDE